ncbi:MAG: thymidine kinase [Planctomycetes bacterium]|nr:thymidine kinase [Planctomycetota bacterium]
MIQTQYRTRCLLPRTERPVREVTLITAAMFAGKTTELLERCFRHQLAGRTVRLLKPVTDDRYSASHVVSHRGLRVECETIERIGRLDGADVFGIDEVNLLPPFTDEALDAAARGVTVIAAGLMRDAEGVPFETTLQLAGIADEVVTLYAVCRCGSMRATHTLRKCAGGPRIQVGGAELYEPACRACWDLAMENRREPA